MIPRFLPPNNDNVYGDYDMVSSLAVDFYSSLPLPLDYVPSPSWDILPFREGQPRDPKRLKCTTSALDSIESDTSGLTGSSCSTSTVISRSSSSSSLISLPDLHFRDHIRTYTRRYLAAEVVEEAADAISDGTDEERNNVSGDGMRLVQLLISCAEAVACRDKAHASALLSELRVNYFGSSFQRVASCFVQGLADRLASVQPLGAVGYGGASALKLMNAAASDNNNNNNNDKEKEEALNLVYDYCPHIRFAHFVANSAILEAFEGESFIHVVDLGMTLCLPRGHQWRHLIKSFADRGGCRRLRITAVGLCVDKFRVIRHDLEAYAKEYGIDFEFSVVESNLENLNPRAIKTYNNEVLVVNSMLQLHCVVKESRGALNSVLQIIHELSPKLFIMAEQDSSHNGPFFLGRFMEALHYYSAIFDSLDAMLPKYDTKRAKMEQFYFAEEIKNIVSCEGPARVERHERLDQWRRRISRAGFQAAPIKMMAGSQKWLKDNTVCEGFTVMEEKGCLVLGWKTKPIIAISCWK